MVLPSCSITGAVMILLVLPGLQQQVKAWRSVAEMLTFMPAQLMRVCTKKRFCNSKRSENAEKITNAKHYPLNIIPSLYSLIRAFSEKVFTFNNPQQISWLLSTLHISFWYRHFVEFQFHTTLRNKPKTRQLWLLIVRPKVSIWTLLTCSHFPWPIILQSISQHSQCPFSRIPHPTTEPGFSGLFFFFIAETILAP